MNQNGYQPRNGYPEANAYPPQNGYPQPNGYPAPGGYPARNGYPAQDGYQAPASAGYTAQAPQGGAPNQTGGYPAGYGYNYSQGSAPVNGENGYYTAPGPAAPAQTPYYPGYPAPGNNAYTQPPQGTGGSYIPQTPYSAGYTTPGYQPAPPAQQGTAYNPLGQMGRNPQNTASRDPYGGQVPLNGGGYVPPPVPVRKQPFEFKDIFLILMGAVLAGLVIIRLVTFRSSDSLLGAVSGFAGVLAILFAVGTTVLLWLKKLSEENKRICYTIIAGALSVVMIVTFLPIFPNGSQSSNKGPGYGIETSVTGTNGNDTGSAGNDVNPTPAPAGTENQPTATPATPEESEEAVVKLIQFFNYWHNNQQEEMLTLCMPSWRNKQENARTALFSLMANRFPQNFTFESITGTAEDTSREVTFTTSMDKNNGKPAVLYRMTVLMVKENGDWYVDPKSLQTNDPLETPASTATPSPTPEPNYDPNMSLYFNPDGGELYHADPNCRTVADKYKPLKGHFTYSQLNDEQYKKLKPCNVCNAPLRK